MFKSFSKNYVGRDFVVGDIHGCFSKLEKALKEESFNEATDRLFSVGDLVDRGPESHRCLEFLSKSWFHAIKGNHEDMAVQYIDGIWPVNNYILNGGQWLLDIPADGRGVYVEAFKKLPYAIEVDSWNSGKVGLVHAECPLDDWEEFKSQLLNYPHLNGSTMVANFEDCLWSRTRINSNDQSVVENIDHIFVGHTPVRKPSRLGNHVYIDTGAVFKGDLTIIQL